VTLLDTVEDLRARGVVWPREDRPLTRAAGALVRTAAGSTEEDAPPPHWPT
jgi:hypothetical protein